MLISDQSGELWLSRLGLKDDSLCHQILAESGPTVYARRCHKRLFGK